MDFKKISMMKRELNKCGNGNNHVRTKLLPDKLQIGTRSTLSSPEELCMSSSTNSVVSTFQKMDTPQGKNNHKNSDSNSAKTAQGVMVMADSIKHRRQIEKNQEEWRHLAMVLDRLFFWIFVVIILLSTIIVLSRGV